jgi:hypothetical protein
MQTVKIPAWLVVATVVASIAVIHPRPSAAEADAFLGTWVLNVAKSKYTPGPPPKEQTVTYESTPEGLKITVKGTNGDGTPMAVTSTGKLDGKDYPSTGSPDWDMQAIKVVSPKTLEFTRKKGGKVVQTATNVVSEDGKSRTFTMTGVNAKGEKISSVAVYEKK